MLGGRGRDAFSGAPRRPAYAQPLSPSRQVPASMADSNRPQPLRQPPPTARLTASGAASEGPSLPMRPLGGGLGLWLWRCRAIVLCVVGFSRWGRGWLPRGFASEPPPPPFLALSPPATPHYAHRSQCCDPIQPRWSAHEVVPRSMVPHEAPK